MKDAHGRHVKECGRVFTCNSCEDQFKSSNALYKHQKRSGHGHKSKEKKYVSKHTHGMLPVFVVVVMYMYSQFNALYFIFFIIEMIKLDLQSLL